MKTLKSFLALALFTTLAIVTSANSYNISKYEVSTNNDLKAVISQRIKSDFTDMNNFFQQNDIYKLKESVEITFSITKDKKLKLISAECKNADACDYVREVLNNIKINVDDSFIGKKFKMELKLDYRN